MMGKKNKSDNILLAKFSRDSVDLGEILQWFTAQLVNFVNGVKIVNFTKYEKLVQAAFPAIHDFIWPYWLKKTLSVSVCPSPPDVIINFLISRDFKISKNLIRNIDFGFINLNKIKFIESCDGNIY